MNLTGGCSTQHASRTDALFRNRRNRPTQIPLLSFTFCSFVCVLACLCPTRHPVRVFSVSSPAYVFDFLDCMEHCELQNRKRLSVIRNVIKDRCRSFMRGDEMNLACISKYHTVVEVRCLSYLSEASQHVKNWQQTPSQQSCRYLYYHNSCLVNTMNSYCPNASRHFTYANLRDYFLSFLLPADDYQFSDNFLDECEIYNLAKISKLPLSITKEISVTQPMNYAETTINNKKGTDAKVKATFKKLFSPDIDLLDIPPNFFYSSLKLRSSGMKQRKEDTYSEKQSRNNGIDFGTHSNNHKEVNSEEHTPRAVDEPFENADVAIYVDNFTRPDTKTTPATSTAVTDNDLIGNYPSSYGAELPAATVMTHKLLSVFPPVTIPETDSSVTKIAQYSTLPQMAISVIKTSTPGLVIDNTLRLPLTKATEEIYINRLSTVRESTVISKSEMGKILPTTKIDGVKYVGTLSTAITDDENFENLMNTGQIDATTVTTVTTHHVTSSSKASAVISTSTLHPSLTLTSPTTETILQPMVTMPQNSIVPLKHMNLLDQIDSQPNVPNDTNRRLKPTEVLQFKKSLPPASITAIQNTLIPIEVMENISKAKLYKIFSIPPSTTALTKQMFMLENAELQTTTAVNPAIWSSGTKFYELKFMSKINNKTSPKTSSPLEAITRMAAALGKRRESNSFKIDFLNQDRNQNGTTARSEVTLPTAVTALDGTMISENFNKSGTKNTKEYYSLLYIYGMLISVAVLAAIVPLASIALRH